MNNINIVDNKVSLSNDFMSIAFNRNYGGAALDWIDKATGAVLVNPFPGEGCNGVFDTGNDGTQASPDGLLVNKINAITASSLEKDFYFGSETTFTKEWDDSGVCSYGTEGNWPYFWMSHEAIDDCIPPDPRGDSGWNTLYHNFLNLSPSIFTSPGVPLIFAARPGIPSGMILIGDEIKSFYNGSTPWNERYCKIKDGFFAARYNVSLAAASADAVSGLMFRKTVPTGPNKNINDLYNAPGYQLNVNKQGGVEIRKNGTEVLWSGSGFVSQVNSTQGLKVEVRTKKDDLSKIDIYLNAIFQTTINCPGTADGIGFFNTVDSGQIWITNRKFYDMNISGSQLWIVEDDCFVGSFSVSSPVAIPMYRLNLPVIFLHTAIREGYIWKDTSGVKHNSTDAVPPGEIPGILNMANVHSIWIGKMNKSKGLYFSNILYSTSSGGENPHIGISPAHIAFNPLSYAANETPLPINAAHVSFSVKQHVPSGW